MSRPVVVVASGGLPIVEATNGFGVPMTVASNGYGLPVTIATNGLGLPVVATGLFVDTGAPAILFTPIASVVGGGAPVVDEILVCTQGTWTNSPTGYAYQWYRTT